MKAPVTSAADFIGMYVVQILLTRGDQVVGINNLNDYYDPKLKLAREEYLAMSLAELTAKIKRGGIFIIVKTAYTAAAIKAAGFNFWRL